MKVDEKLIKKIAEKPIDYRKGMVFNIHDNTYILAFVDSIEECKNNQLDITPLYSLINLYDFNRWTDPLPIGEVMGELWEEGADYLGRIENIGALILAYPKDCSIIKEIDKETINAIG